MLFKHFIDSQTGQTSEARSNTRLLLRLLDSLVAQLVCHFLLGFDDPAVLPNMMGWDA